MSEIDPERIVITEPAAHEFLALEPDDTAFVNEATAMRNIEGMQMGETWKVRSRIDMDLAAGRIDSIHTPLLVMGREGDHLQGIFRTSYELLKEAGKEVEWVSYDHPLHGYIYPLRGEDGAYAVDETQAAAVGKVISFFDSHLKA
jgi:acetyl esterase/lipase